MPQNPDRMTLYFNRKDKELMDKLTALLKEDERVQNPKNPGVVSRSAIVKLALVELLERLEEYEREV